jgi:predicted translin family RNA/ssDNA-binding protein
MSEYEGLREDIAMVADSLARYSSTVGRATGSHDLEIRKLWDEQAELRDEINAVANRVESLTRAVMADPAEVAAAIVNDANRENVQRITDRRET